MSDDLRKSQNARRPAWATFEPNHGLPGAGLKIAQVSPRGRSLQRAATMRCSRSRDVRAVARVFERQLAIACIREGPAASILKC